MKNIFKDVQYSKLIVCIVVLLYFLLIPYSLVYAWKFEANTVLITILTTIGGVVAVVCNGYMIKSRFENVLKIQQSLDKSAASTTSITSEVQQAVQNEIKETLNEEITILSNRTEDMTENKTENKAVEKTNIKAEDKTEVSNIHSKKS